MLARQRYSRRELFKVSGAAAVAVALYRVTDWVTPSAARAATRSEWIFSDGLPGSGVFETPILWPAAPFNAIDLTWLSASARGAGMTFWARASGDGASWTEWYELRADLHELVAGAARGFATPLLAEGRALQARVEIAPGAALRELTVGALDSSPDPSAKSLEAAVAPIDGFIIPRAGWGADEALRHVNQKLTKPIVWPPEYQSVEKVIVHHTATSNTVSDAAAAIRSIYYYHAITRGWGDIGYNFLVDWQGNVYEGRFGGAKVVGGHALQYNYGSLGIALLGDFTSVNPPDVMLGALIRAIEDRAPQVDVTTSADFVDLRQVPNLCGHGDVMATSCPGDDAHALLPLVRGLIAGTDPIYLDPPIIPEGIQLVDFQVGPTTVYQGNLLEVRVTVSNPGSTTLATQGPEPGYIYAADADFNSAGFPKEQDAYRIGLDIAGNQGTNNPYRWGLGSPLEPGAVRDVVGYVRLDALGTQSWSISVVKEFVKYYVDHDFPVEIEVDQPPTQRTPQSADSAMRYFSETGHNVPAIFANYWDANGGLTRFGYPLTEAFEEVSETDGGRYVTQYFERARFERHPDDAGTASEVQLGLLGAELAVGRATEQPFRRIKSFHGDATHTYFEATGHSVAYAFKDYWAANGGLPIFGYPISEEFDEVSETDGVVHTVQYFERNRFEYHPEYADTDAAVLLGHMAREVLIARGWLGGPQG